MKKYKGRRYTGKELKKYQEVTIKQDEKTEKVIIDAYHPSEKLVYAVEIARILGRPLLVQGKPGVGKTRLAEAIAYELYKENYKEYYFEWPIKSTTTAKEGLYTYDYLKKLKTIKENEKNPSEKANVEKKALENEENFIIYGPLGKTIMKASEKTRKPPVLLIDEIDKADIDFPNDLLWELEKKEFTVTETSKKYDAARNSPIVIITSNNEKELPGAFLRRCVHHKIELPEKDGLMKIVESMIEAEFAEHKSLINKENLDTLLDTFIKTREIIENKWENNHIPSTSELLDWIRVILYYRIKGWDIDGGTLVHGSEEVKIIPDMILKKS